MEILKILIEKKTLSAELITALIKDVEKGRISALQQAAILGGLNVKGITARELAGFVQAFATKIQPFPTTSGVHLIGDGGNFAPIAFILSGIGVPVMHQVPYSYRRGTEIPLSRDAEKNRKIFEQLRISFSPTQKLHPVLEKWKTLGHQMKIRTIVDLSLPLLQAAPSHLNIMHAGSKEEMLTLVEAAKILRIKQVLVLHNPERIPFKLFATELRNGKMKTHTFSEKSFGAVFEKASESSQDFYQNFLQRKPSQQVLISSSLALVFSGHISSLKKAYQHANNFILSGKAHDHFLAYNKAVSVPALFLSIIEWKQKEILRKKKNISLKKFMRKTKVSDRDFKKSLLSHRPALITEIDSTTLRSSAKFLQQGRIQALSIATDEKFFNGSLRHLSKARELMKEIPLLCKDFIIDEYQIYEARRFGADAIVLKISLLNRDQVRHFLQILKVIRMTAVCEVRSDDDLELALANEAEVISIHTANITQALRWIKKIPEETIVVFEGSTPSAFKKISGKIDAILAGPKVLKMNDLSKSVERLIGKPKPLIKMCGIRSLEQAAYCQKIGVDLIGLNFVPSSHRRISYQLGEQIIQKIRQNKKSGMKVVGVFQDQDLSEVNTAAEKLDLDFIQLSGGELISYVKKCKRPVIKEVPIVRKSSLNTAARYASASKYISLDWSRAGFDERLLKKCLFPYFMGGEVTTDRFRDLQKTFRPLGFNVSSAIETEGEVDLKKVRKILGKK